MQRPLDRRAGGDADHSAIAHQSRVQGHCDVVSWRQLAKLRGKRTIPVGQRLCQRRDGQSGVQVA